MSNVPPVNNPFAPPTSSSQMRASGEDETIRNHHLSHEASVKSIGFLYMLGGVLGIILGVTYIAMGVAGNAPPEFEQFKIFMIGLGVFCLILSALQIYGAISVRKLQGAGRIIVTVFSAFGLLGIPIGTLISGYILYLLWSQKGNFIFTPEYQRIIQATPHIKYKTSIVIWILLGLVLLLIAIAIIAAVAGASV